MPVLPLSPYCITFAKESTKSDDLGNFTESEHDAGLLGKRTLEEQNKSWAFFFEERENLINIVNIV